MASKKEIRLAIIANAHGREKLLEKAFLDAIKIFKLDVNLTVSVFNAFENIFPDHDQLNNIDGIVISGSPYGVHDQESQPWIKKEVEFAKQLLEIGFPIMAVCFGHQVLASAAGEIIKTSPKDQEIGVHEIHSTDVGANSVYKKLPQRSFQSTQAHQDHLVTVPDGAIPLAYSQSREGLLIVQALLYGNNQISIQYHPEYDWLAMVELIKKHAQWFLDHGVNTEQLKKDLEEFDNMWALLVYAYWIGLLAN